MILIELTPHQDSRTILSSTLTTVRQFWLLPRWGEFFNPTQPFNINRTFEYSAVVKIMMVTFECWPLLLPSAILLKFNLAARWDTAGHGCRLQYFIHTFNQILWKLLIRYWGQVLAKIILFDSLWEPTTRGLPIPAGRIYFCCRIATDATAHWAVIKMCSPVISCSKYRLIPGVVKLIYFYE